MSGGSMDYLHERVSQCDIRGNTPERRAFAAHLQRVATALHDIEWVDSGDYSPGDEIPAIRACLGDDTILATTIDMAREVLALLTKAIGDAEAHR